MIELNIPGRGTVQLLHLVTDVNGTLYFRAEDGSSGNELWKSDGTNAGTVMVRDINAGVADTYPSYLISISGMLYFAANDGSSGNELWKSDGTAAGTVMVRDIYDGASSSGPHYMTDVNGTLFFRANHDIYG